jgi:hypothetical protein
MKKNIFKQFGLLFLLSAVLIISFSPTETKAQSDNLSLGADYVTTYVWRGVAYSGPSFQPYVEYSTGGFAIGAWGSQGYDGFQEMDIYAGYTVGGFYIGVTDYYYPPSGFFDYGEDESHALEINAAYEIDSFSLSGNIIPQAGAGASGTDLYFEAAYSFENAALAVGAGDGWHSTDTEFALVNITLSTSKEIEVTEKFSLPVFGSVTLNPDAEVFYIVAGFSF